VGHIDEWHELKVTSATSRNLNMSE
jgi:hypothetical protein